MERFTAYLEDWYPSEWYCFRDVFRVEKWLQDHSEDAERYLIQAIALCGMKYVDFFDGKGFTHLLEVLRAVQKEAQKVFLRHLGNLQKDIPRMRSLGLAAVTLGSFDPKHWEILIPILTQLVNQKAFSEVMAFKPGTSLSSYLIQDDTMILRLFIEAYLSQSNSHMIKWLPELLGTGSLVRYFYTQDQWRSLLKILAASNEYLDYQVLKKLPHFISSETTPKSILALGKTLSHLCRAGSHHNLNYFGHTVLHPQMEEKELEKFFSEMLDPHLSEDDGYFILFALQKYREKWRDRDLSVYGSFYEGVKGLITEPETEKYHKLSELAASLEIKDSKL